MVIWGSQAKQCTDSLQTIRRYQSKLSGPLLDRIDLHIEVLEIPRDDLTNQQLCGEKSFDVKLRVESARKNTNI